MKLLSNGLLSKCIEYALCALMIIAAFLTVTLNWSIPMVTLHRRGSVEFVKYFVVLMVSGVMSLLILWQARCIMRIINRGNPFINDLVRRLRLTGAECLLLAVIYFISVFIINKFFMVVVFVTFSVVGLILFVFAELFRQAIEYKDENDMTI